MKLSVSLTDSDVTELDDFVRESGLSSRSAGIQRAIRQLRHPHLEQDYADAFAEWDAAGEGDLWESVAGDGLGSDRRSTGADAKG